MRTRRDYSVTPIGKKFGRLTVTGYSYKDQRGNRIWSCHCDCGNITQVAAANLHAGNVKSCGCLRRDWMKDGRRYKERDDMILFLWEDDNSMSRIGVLLDVTRCVVAGVLHRYGKDK